MAGSVNKVILVGNLGQDPRISRTQDGKAMANLSVATSESWREKSTGDRKERTEWHRVVIFAEGLVTLAEQCLKKGAKVYIEGKQQTRKWTAQDGTERYATEVVLNGFGARLEMLDGRNSSGPPPAQTPDDYGYTESTSVDRGAGEHGASERAGKQLSYQSKDLDDDIPF
ncbi:single-stranded DNA-binding protein [Martelella sp. AD-3]|uniref:single-stranded DNA-binding protein n=1 Tax=Martelella sp. AD-3 TaxID=686597 RepID=UPI0004636A69|nr:single-stranded DNA-binding protein [Martelella sp. AD-3]AMM84136.1 single-stranded DNA-binding protein [Martelella sp. AD-3]